MNTLQKNAIIVVTILIGCSSCSTLNFNNLKYDNNLELYKYPIFQNTSIFVRNENDRLIDKDNIDSFYVELEKKEFKYSFKESLENDKYLKFTDLKITKLYTEINQHIESKEFNSALSKLNQLEAVYPAIVKFSDVHFLRAITYGQTDSLDKAKESYADFLNYSSGKYSARFRGNRDLDLNDSIWGLQRKYAREKLSDPTANNYSLFLSDITPKYHYNSFQPGFLLNPEDYSRGVKWVTMLIFGMDYSNRFGLGYQVNRKLKSNLDLNLWAMASGNTTGLGGGVPIQVYKSPDDRFGIKLSPFASFSYTDSITVDDTNYRIRQVLVNFGAKLSGGYYLLPNLALGAYYKYNFHNTNNPILTKNHNINLWWHNELDLSLYYDISKGLSFKAGLYNGDIVSGLFWSGWEIGYNITNQSFIVRIEMY